MNKFVSYFKHKRETYIDYTHNINGVLRKPTRLCIIWFSNLLTLSKWGNLFQKHTMHTVLDNYVFTARQYMYSYRMVTLYVQLSHGDTICTVIAWWHYMHMIIPFCTAWKMIEPYPVKSPATVISCWTGGAFEKKGVHQ